MTPTLLTVCSWFLWRGRRFLRRAAPLTLLRARPTWRVEAASPLLLSRSFLPRVQWAPCGPTPSLFSAVYLLNVGYYSRRERKREREREKIITSKNWLFLSFTFHDQRPGGERPSRWECAATTTPRPIFCECKCTCSLKPVAYLPTPDSRGIYICSLCLYERVYVYTYRPSVGYNNWAWQRGLLFHLQETWIHFEGFSHLGHVFFFFSLLPFFDDFSFLEGIRRTRAGNLKRKKKSIGAQFLEARWWCEGLITHFSNKSEGQGEREKERERERERRPFGGENTARNSHHK